MSKYFIAFLLLIAVACAPVVNPQSYLEETVHMMDADGGIIRVKEFPDTATLPAFTKVYTKYHYPRDAEVHREPVSINNVYSQGWTGRCVKGYTKNLTNTSKKAILEPKGIKTFVNCKLYSNPASILGLFYADERVVNLDELEKRITIFDGVTV